MTPSQPITRFLEQPLTNGAAVREKNINYWTQWDLLRSVWSGQHQLMQQLLSTTKAVYWEQPPWAGLMEWEEHTHPENITHTLFIKPSSSSLWRLLGQSRGWLKDVIFLWSFRTVPQGMKMREVCYSALLSEQDYGKTTFRAGLLTGPLLTTLQPHCSRSLSISN